MKSIETAVLIVGAGPAGLSLAMDLASRNISCMLVERRVQWDPHPRASLLGARSMELFRRHGVADEIIEAGLPPHHPYEIHFVTSLTGHLLHAYSSPSPNQYREMHAGERAPSHDAGWSPYFKVQIGQHMIEPVLRRYLEGQPSLVRRFGWELVSFETTGDSVSAIIRNAETGEEQQVYSRFLAACDGARSLIKRQLAIPYVGRGAIGRNRSFLFHAPGLMDVASTGRANLHFVYNKSVYGVITDLDGKGLYNYSYFNPSPERYDADPRDVIRTAVGADVEFEVLRTMDWAHHQSVAASMRKGPVFLLGDAAHLFCPSAGIGMNTAIADAFDLGWKMAAVIEGWGGEGLLESYEKERWPIAVRNTIAAADNRDRIDCVLETVDDRILADTPEGDEQRRALQPRLVWLTKQFNTMGLHLGGRYAESNIVVRDGSAEPADDPRNVSQSTWPSCRAPHAWIKPGQSTLDWYGKGYVLVTAGHADEAAKMQSAFASRHIPFEHRVVTDSAIQRLYEKRLVLVRPDGHVCWRGDALPDSLEQMVAFVTGN